VTILDRALSVAGTAKTFAVNFWPWLLGAFLLGGAVVAYPTFAITRAVYQRATFKCQAQHATFTTQLATNAADTERQVGAMILGAEQRIAARDAAIAADVAAIPSLVAKQLQPELLAFRSAINADPIVADCLARPLPAGALRVLERPGGPIAPAAGPGP
jgi:hypothetical protein